MNESTEKLVRELADRLGTTAEHLWGVLVRQAPISALLSLAVCVAWATFFVWAFYLVQRKTKEPPRDNDGYRVHAEWRAEGAFFAWVVWGIGTVIAVFALGCEIHASISALINPEYWAFKQLIK